MLAKKFEIGDLVWAKMKNFPPWPAKVIDPPAAAKLKKNHHYVFFFGSQNHAWISDENINHHSEQQLEACKKKRTAVFQSAIDEIVRLSKDRPIKIEVDEEIETLSAETSSRMKPSPQQVKPEDGKKSPVAKVSKKRLSSIKSGKNHHGHNSFAKVQRCDGETSSKSLGGSASPSYSSNPAVSSYDDDSAVVSPRGIELSSSPPLELNKISGTSKVRHVPPTHKKIGFLGLGMMGQGIVKNLLKSGHRVTVWNRSTEKCFGFITAGASGADSPAAVVRCSDIIFCCVSDPQAAKCVVFGLDGVLKGLDDSLKNGERARKGYIEMTSIDSETSQEIAEAINIKGCKYLEAPITGSGQLAEEGSLLILASGDWSLFNACETCFHAISKHVCYVSHDIGQSSKYNLIISNLMGTTYAALAEALTLAERMKVPLDEFLDIIQLKGMVSAQVLEKAKCMLDPSFPRNSSLKHQQKDIHLALHMGDTYHQPMPVSAAANHLYIHAKLIGNGDNDISAVIQGAKF